MESPFSSIAVIGLGLIGASFAGAYREVYPTSDVIGVDSDERTLNDALARGIVTTAMKADDPDLGSRLADTDLVVIATPVTAAPRFFALLGDINYQGIVTDTCSTKLLVAKEALDVLPDSRKYLPGHPMAGSEKSGIDGARSDLFEGAHWILCPDDSTPADTFAAMHEMLTGIGARVVSLPRELHDEAIAVVSHVPHFVASSLVELAVRHAQGEDALFRLAAGGFKDSTRVAAGSPQLWTGIAFENADSIVSGLREMQQILGEYADTLEGADSQAFTALLDRAAKARRSIPARWVPKTEDLLEVRIPLTNKPGIIAEVTTIASSAGCNIQSIEIDHITSSSAELVLLLTDEGDFGKLSTQLLKNGFRLSLNPLMNKEADDE